MKQFDQFKPKNHQTTNWSHSRAVWSLLRKYTCQILVSFVRAAVAKAHGKCSCLWIHRCCNGERSWSPRLGPMNRESCRVFSENKILDKMQPKGGGTSALCTHCTTAWKLSVTRCGQISTLLLVGMKFVKVPQQVVASGTEPKRSLYKIFSFWGELGASAPAQPSPQRRFVGWTHGDVLIMWSRGLW